jgi:Domain of unknown function (DUF1707)
VATRRTPGTRAKDSDRTDICQVLDSALAEGQLSIEEHGQRVSAATHATTLGDLQSLIGDLQPTNPLHPPVTHLSMLRRGPVVIAAVAGVAVVLIGAIAWAVTGEDSSSADTATTSSAGPGPAAPETHVLTAAPSTTSEAPDEPAPVVLTPRRELHTAEGMTLVIDEMRKRFGDTTGYELAIMSDEAVLARPDPTDDRSKLIYSFEGGWGDPSARPRSDTDDVTDLGAFDVAAAAAALQAAPETLHIAPSDVSETFIDIDHIADPAGPGALELLVKVTTTSGANGFLYLDGASNIKRVEYPD